MKKVIYSQNKEILITNEEFRKCMILWAQKKDCFMERLQCLLSPHFLLVQDTDEDFLDYDIFLYRDSNKLIGKLYKKDNKYYQLERSDVFGERLVEVNLSKESEKNIMNQEDYYSKKFLLK